MPPESPYPGGSPPGGPFNIEDTMRVLAAHQSVFSQMSDSISRMAQQMELMTKNMERVLGLQTQMKDVAREHVKVLSQQADVSFEEVKALERREELERRITHLSTENYQEQIAFIRQRAALIRGNDADDRRRFQQKARDAESQLLRITQLRSQGAQPPPAMIQQYEDTVREIMLQQEKEGGERKIAQIARRTESFMSQHGLKQLQFGKLTPQQLVESAGSLISAGGTALNSRGMAPRLSRVMAGAAGGSQALGAGMVATQILRGATTGLYGGIENMYQSAAGRSISLGQQAGFSGGQGIGNMFTAPLAMLGIGGSDAAQAGWRMRLHAIGMGLNPFDALGMGQASQLISETIGRGYQGRQARTVEDALKDIVNNTAIGSTDALNYLDVTVKRLGMNVKEAKDNLEGFGAAAQLAGKSPQEYAAAATQQASQLTSQGISATNQAGLIAGLNTIPGINGTDLLQAIQSPNTMALIQSQMIAGGNSSMGVALNPLNQDSSQVLTALTSGLTQYYRQLTSSGVDEATAYVMTGQLYGMTAEQAKALIENQKMVKGQAQTAQLHSQLNRDFNQSFGPQAQKTRMEGMAKKLGLSNDEFAYLMQNPLYAMGMQKKLTDRSSALQGPQGKKLGQDINAFITSLPDKELGQANIKSYRDRLFSGESPDKVYQDIQRDLAAAKDTEGTLGQRNNQNFTIQAVGDLKDYVKILKDNSSQSVSDKTLRTGSERNADDNKDQSGLYRLRGSGGGG